MKSTKELNLQNILFSQVGAFVPYSNIFRYFWEEKLNLQFFKENLKFKQKIYIKIRQKMSEK